MKCYRGQNNNGIEDAKNIGTYYTSSIDEAKFYGENIEIADIDITNFLTVDENELKRYISKWLKSLDDDEREYQMATGQYETMQMDEMLAARDAKNRGYKGVILKNIRGEWVDVCDYIIVF